MVNPASFSTKLPVHSPGSLSPNWTAVPPGQVDGPIALLNRDGLVYRCRSQPDEMAARAVWKLRDRHDARRLVRDLAHTLPNARCLIWDMDLYKTATNGQAAFTDQPARVEGVNPTVSLVSPSFWCWQKSLVMSEAWLQFLELPKGSEQQQTMVLMAPGVTEAGRMCAEETGVAPPSEKIGRLGVTFIDVWISPEPAYYLRAFPPLFEGEPVPEGMTGHYAAFQFLGLPFVGTEKAEASRQQRRQYERKSGFSGSVNYITLRRPALDPGPHDPGTARAWSCQWLVRAHWRRRAQRWGPGQPIFVHPHSKGPKDKPFRVSRETVYHAKR